MTDVWPHSQAHILISTSLLGAPHPTPLAMHPHPRFCFNDRYYRVLYDICTKQTQYPRRQEEEKGMENRQMSGRGCGDLVLLLLCTGLKVPH